MPFISKMCCLLLIYISRRASALPAVTWQKPQKKSACSYE
jgi:hypothetical protein